MELFAGVGGFRLGLEGLGTPGHPKNESFDVVWSNQWEPSSKRQHASEVYVAQWGADGHVNEDLFAVVADPEKFQAVIAAKPDVLVGGFPCQDYSVAKPADQALGIEGKKGVLWWGIRDCLAKLAAAGQPVRYLMLENVDRLLKANATNRGRDFAIILSSLAALGYAVEWRVVNAADYGHPQRRRRVFIVAYHASTALCARATASAALPDPAEWLTVSSVLAQALPAQLPSDMRRHRSTMAFDIDLEPLVAQETYRASKNGDSRFLSAGFMVAGRVFTANLQAIHVAEPAFPSVHRPAETLGDVVRATTEVHESFYLPEAELPRWAYLKGAKSERRTAANGYEYRYTEGAMTFPDALERPSRTIITSEGGSGPSRCRHVVRSSDGRLRRLTPDELEELNGFPRGYSGVGGISDARRGFLMGNAVVVGIIRVIGLALSEAAGSQRR